MPRCCWLWGGLLWGIAGWCAGGWGLLVGWVGVGCGGYGAAVLGWYRMLCYPRVGGAGWGVPRRDTPEAAVVPRVVLGLAGV